MIVGIGKKQREMVNGRGFFDWVRSQPEWRCIITGRPHNPSIGDVVERAHIKSKGAGGSYYYIMPLLTVEHVKSHSKPAWWYRHKAEIAEWCAEVLPMLWERYEDELRAEAMGTQANGLVSGKTS